MHDIQGDEDRQKIVSVHSSELEGNTIHAVITTEHYGRRVQKPYAFELNDWAEIIERGYIE